MRAICPKLLCVLPLLLLLGACSGQAKVDVAKLGPPPSAQELAALHNQRVAPIESLWARVSVRAKGTYDDGETFEQQGEGHLQIVTPERVSLTIGKLGETYFAFGANESQYWSFDLSDADHKVLLVGALATVTQEKAAALGLPVHPQELIALTGLAPIDLSRAGGTRWADDGRSVGIAMPSRWGGVTLWIDPKTGHAVRSEAFDDAGRLVARAQLSRYKDATLGDGRRVQVPGKVEITTPGDDGFVRIELSGPAGKAIRAMVYDPGRLSRVYRVDETIDLDEAFAGRTRP